MDPGACVPDTDPGWGHGQGGCVWPSPCRWARARADATASGGHRPDTQEDIVAMMPLGFHLSHGFARAFQALGVVVLSMWTSAVIIVALDGNSHTYGLRV